MVAAATKQPQVRSQAPAGNTKGSPSRIPARVPLSNLRHGNNSPERPRPESRARPESRIESANPRHGASMRAPPPKMRELLPPPELLETPANPYRGTGLESSIVRNVEPEDVYDDRYRSHNSSRPMSRDYASMRPPAQSSYPQAPPPARQISNTSTVVTSSTSNWESYGDSCGEESEPEMNVSETYYAKLRAARQGKRQSPDTAYARPGPGQAKRQRGIPPATHAGHAMDRDRIISSEWTDEDAF